MKKTIGLLGLLCVLMATAILAAPQIIQEKNTLDRFRMTDASGKVNVNYMGNTISMEPGFQYSYADGRVYSSLTLQGNDVRLSMSGLTITQEYYNTQYAFGAKHNAQLTINRVRSEGIVYLFWDKVANTVGIYAFNNNGQSFNFNMNVVTPKCADYFSTLNPTIPMC